jgi:hypothetical protein
MNQPLGFTDPTGFEPWNSTTDSNGNTVRTQDNTASDGSVSNSYTGGPGSSSGSSSGQKQQPKDNPQKRNENTSTACANGSCSGSDSSKVNIFSETVSWLLGGYDKHAQASWDRGDYVGWGINTAFATTYGVLNVVSFGDAGVVSQGLTFAAFGVVKTLKGEAATLAKGLAEEAGGAAQRVGKAYNVADAPKLAGQLTRQSAESPFTTSGALTADAIAASKAVPNLGPGQLSNPAIPSGFGKYTTETFQSQAGNFQVHFYMNPKTNEVFYGLDYKSIFNSMSGVGR